jgi:hypothetical protein
MLARSQFSKVGCFLEAVPPIVAPAVAHLSMSSFHILS